jgi:hypothetical protein
VEKNYVIYLLRDPRDGLVHYVGQTKQPELRLENHRQGRAGRGSRDCRDWEISLVAQGLCCECEIVEEDLTAQEADAKERWWIAHGLECGWPLTNLVCGVGQRGSGGKENEGKGRSS